MRWLFSVLSLALRMPYYAVKVGKAPGIFETWAECERQVHGFAGAVFKKFALLCEAEEFLRNEVVGNSSKKRKEKRGINERLDLPTKASKRSKIVNASAVDSLVPIAFMHDLLEADKVLQSSLECIGTIKGTADQQQSRNRGVYQSSPKGQLSWDSGCEDSHRQNGWKLADGKPVLLKDDIQRLVKELSTPGLQVSWCHTPGHQGEWGNEQADKLAEKGANLPYTYNDNGGEDPSDTDADFTEADV
ncbi:Ribonuclease H1 [Taenia crassiceps]|uniref:ribonuclease H n=1 Tax=Taenia crassiceps TaxID=6207 RepID=A0ABR4QLF4_9CEST